MALPKVIRDPQVVAKVHEFPLPAEADLVVDWDRHPVEISIGDYLPEVTKHAFLFEQLVRLAEQLALRDGHIRRRASFEYLEQLANRLFWILAHTDLYRPVSSRAAEEHIKEETGAALAEAQRERARPVQPADVVDIATHQPSPRPARRARPRRRNR